jgi:hypothetical protein
MPCDFSYLQSRSQKAPAEEYNEDKPNGRSLPTLHVLRGNTWTEIATPTREAFRTSLGKTETQSLYYLTEVRMQKVVAMVTLVFFAAVALVLVIGGWSVIFPGDASTTTSAACTPIPCEMPVAPEAPAPPTPTTDTAAFSQQVSAYQHQVTAYKERVTAYDKFLSTWASQRAKGPDRQVRYQAVVKDALLPILNPLVAAFIAYAFVKGTTNAIQNIMAARNTNAQLKDFKL